MANNLDPNSMYTDELIEENKAKVNEVIGIMETNLQKILERGVQLDVINKQTNTLLNEATTFGNMTNEIKKELWWKNIKVTIILGILGAIILVIIVWMIICKLTS